MKALPTFPGLIDAPIKRIAWALGCARKDSDEEIALYRLLVDRVSAERAKR